MKIVKKITLAGDSTVGKTSLIRRFVYDHFDDKYIVTVGAKVTKKEFVLMTPSMEPVNLTLMIWDIMGLVGYRPELHKANFSGARGALVVCDITRRDTLQSLKSWINSIYEITGNIPIVALINKVDLKAQADFTEEDVKAILADYKCPYLYTSAKTGENVEKAFRTIGELLIK